jgi:hypothetical protein
MNMDTRIKNSIKLNKAKQAEREAFAAFLLEDPELTLSYIRKQPLYTQEQFKEFVAIYGITHCAPGQQAKEQA